MHYLRNWVLAAYRADHPSRRSPSAAILTAYEQTLFNRYEPEIQAQSDSNIPLNLFNRSILVFFAVCSEAATPGTQVDHAYQFFRNTQPTP